MGRKPKTWRSGPASQSPGKEILSKLYREDLLSYEEIAVRYQVNRVTVGRWIHAAGVPVRSHSEATELGRAKWSVSEEHRKKLRQTVARARTSITTESRAKQSAAMIGRSPPNKGKPWTPDVRAKQMAIRTTPEYREKLAASQRGEKSPLWRGGRERRGLSGWEWRRRAAECYERDGWLCRDCGVHCTRKGKNKIQAHHVIPRRHGGNDDLSNLVTLCARCHTKRDRLHMNALFA